MAQSPFSAPWARPPCTDEWLEGLLEEVLRQERLDRGLRGRWGWLGGGRGPSHVCRPPGEVKEGAGPWVCPECHQAWFHELDSGWLPKPV